MEKVSERKRVIAAAFLLVLTAVLLLPVLTMTVQPTAAGLKEAFEKSGAREDLQGPGLQTVLMQLLSTADMFFVVAVLIGIGIGCVMMGLKQQQGMMFVIWALLGGVLYFSMSKLINWMVTEGKRP